MVNELAELAETFRGQCARVRCFNHILNLVVKMLLKQFDVALRQSKRTNGAALDTAEAALQELAQELEMAGGGDDDDDNVSEWDMDGADLDDVEGWVDERDRMSAEEVAEHKATTRPVKLVLVKVC
ncbi:hypothetical protein EVJ58_g10239 [Rhodofomes roseus]|uniref:Uncharacterized protein n=1 Tax=Rhodofomes roseus TaxID=34475 RepID=A0A4Y9XPH8_9APHY|nr:hypothetical protein EVJ58_g10239 [Rhodofomes roseus]